MGVARFFHDGRIKSGTMAFEGAEYHHMVRVTRHQVGDTVCLFDGTGREAEAEITFISRHSATLKVGKVITVPDSDEPRLVLAACIPKAARATWLIEKAVELGVTTIVPLSTSRSVVDPRDSKLESLRATIIAASKQCGRSRLMEVAPLIGWHDFVQSYSQNGAFAVAHPGGVPFQETLVNSMLDEAPVAKEKGSSGIPVLTVAVGPEGGFTVEEISLAVTRGARLVSLGSRILRMETAALMAASVFTAALARA